jgi:hypothetical protein
VHKLGFKKNIDSGFTASKIQKKPLRANRSHDNDDSCVGVHIKSQKINTLDTDVLNVVGEH